jgi:deazaflavin-dependent oxidoreductase (nitroreductase family)
MNNARASLSVRERSTLFLHRELDHRLSPLGVWMMRRSKGSITGPFKVDALALTTTGRRSGRPRNVVLQYFPDGEAMIVVATNDGGATHPAWYLNLASNPAGTVEVDGRRLDVVSSELAGDEASGWWRRIVERSPDYERYTRAAHRTFPILRLTPAKPA